MGGENLTLASRYHANLGSSPRGRGKRKDNVFKIIDRGLIPAWAGKTGIPASMVIKPGAHPRVGGENTPRVPRCEPSAGAHPRVGGENLHQPPTKVQTSGSSPRGRGKPKNEYQELGTLRLIPAWAGKTDLRMRLRCSAPAHPRVGGENLTAHSCLLSLDGSSPRGRGKPESAGIVPSVVGSSPRGRGKLAPRRATKRARRLIPAWAGKTGSSELSVGDRVLSGGCG